MRSARSFTMGVPAQGGCTCPGMHLPGGILSGGVPAWGVYGPEGVYLPRECSYQGVYLVCTYLGEVYLSRGCTCPGSVPVQGVYLSRGFFLTSITPSPKATPRRSTTRGTPFVLSKIVRYHHIHYIYKIIS